MPRATCGGTSNLGSTDGEAGAQGRPRPAQQVRRAAPWPPSEPVLVVDPRPGTRGVHPAPEVQMADHTEHAKSWLANQPAYSRFHRYACRTQSGFRYDEWSVIPFPPVDQAEDQPDRLDPDQPHDHLAPQSAGGE